MKTLMNRILLLAMVMTLAAACGKNSSGGGGSSQTNPSTNWNGWDNNQYNNNGQQQQYNIEQIRSQFAAKSLSDGLQNGLAVYHVGPHYSSSYYGGGNFNFQFQVSGCINLIFVQVGDCGSTGYSNQQYMENIVDMGEFKIVQSSTSTQVNYEEAIGVSNEQFLVTQKTFTRNSSRYTDMLGTNGGVIGGGFQSLVTAAYVRLTNGQQIEAYLIEHFNGYNTTRYVVSPSLPVLANPIAVLDGYGQFQGALKSVGNTNINMIQVNLHQMGYNGQPQTAGYNQLML
jgi:hypothetical protein